MIIKQAMRRYLADHPAVKDRRELAKIVGVHENVLYSINTGSNRISDNTIKRLSEFFKLPFDQVKSEHYRAIEKKLKGVENESI